jgi:hypothetical protein
MRTIIVAAAITLIASSVALAASKRVSPNQARGANAMVMEADPSGVYVDGRLIGRDPDPAIRSRLKDEFYQNLGN